MARGWRTARRSTRLEIDKAAQEVPSPAAGTLKIHGQAGQVYPVGELIAEIL